MIVCIYVVSQVGSLIVVELPQTSHVACLTILLIWKDISFISVVRFLLFIFNELSFISTFMV